jgi:hypothetical protein
LHDERDAGRTRSGDEHEEDAMENKVGDKRMTAQKAASIQSQLQSILTALKPYGITLTTDARRRLLHGRRGAEAHVARVQELAARHKLSIKGIPLEGLQDDLDLSKQFVVFEHDLRAALQLVEDTGLQADAEAWEAFLAYYGVLSSMADRDPGLAAELAPVVEFMATGPRAKKGPAAPEG